MDEQQWVPTNTRSLTTSQLGGIVNAIIDHLHLAIEHRMEKGVVVFRLVNRGPRARTVDFDFGGKET